MPYASWTRSAPSSKPCDDVCGLALDLSSSALERGGVIDSSLEAALERFSGFFGGTVTLAAHLVDQPTRLPLKVFAPLRREHPGNHRADRRPKQTAATKRQQSFPGCHLSAPLGCLPDAPLLPRQAT